MNHILEHPRLNISPRLGAPDGPLATTTVVLESLSGAAIGALVGIVAGPPGAVIGALIGGAAATAAGNFAHADEVRRRAHDRQLDRDIGVTEGDLGTGLAHAPGQGLGAYSLASMGIHDTVPHAGRGSD